jgi:hypothetical protein
MMTPHEQFRELLLEKKREMDCLNKVWKRLNVLVSQEDIDRLIEEVRNAA